MKKLSITKLVLTLLLGCLCWYGHAATYRVSNAGELDAALNAAGPGDVILLAPGTYTTATKVKAFPTNDPDKPTINRSFFFRGANNGTASNKITLKSEVPSNPAVLAGEGFNKSGYVLYITGDHWVVENIKIRSGLKGLIIDNANHCIIKNVEIYDIGQEGLHMRDGSSNTLVDGANLHDIGRKNDGFGEGIYVGSDNSVWWEGNGSSTGEKGRYYRRAVHNTTIINSTIGPNITAEPFDIKEGTENTIVENCIIYGSGVSGSNFADSHIDIKGNTAKIRCNTFYQSNNTKISRAIMIVPRGSAGVPSSLTAQDNYIHDNIFYLDEAGVEMAVANNGAGSNYAWSNTRVPENGDDYNSRIIESEPSGYSNNCSGSTGCQTPSGLSTSGVSKNSAQLNWNNASGANRYTIQWRKAGGSWTTISNISGNSYALNGLSENTAYQWRVRSNCGSENSAFSNSNNFTTSADTGCSTPSALNTTGVSKNSAQLNWNNASGATGYVLRWRPNGGSWATVANISGTNYSLTGLSANTTYQWQVRANCGSANSSYSATESFTTQSDGGGSNCGGQNLSGSKKVEICNISPNQRFSPGSDTPIIINYTNDVNEVKYWYRTSSSAWVWVEKSTSAPFSVDWESIPTSAIAIRARGGTNNGNTEVHEVPIVVANNFRTAPTEEGSIRIYPNPVNQGSQLTIQGINEGIQEAELYDLRGGSIRLYPVSDGEGPININTNQLPTGVYLLRVNDTMHKIHIQ